MIKLGGSLARSNGLRRWLNAIARHGAGHAIIVPGGGRFADEVRDAQRLWGFDDATAHRMAILAMEQYGLMLCGLCGQLAPAASESELTAILKHGDVALWLPSAMTLRASDIPASWSVTADSLAAWLAARLVARRLVLVKALRADQIGGSMDEIRARQIVDADFPNFADCGFAVDVLGCDEYERLVSLLTLTPA